MKTITSFSRECSSTNCKKVIYYKTKQSLDKANLVNSVCHHCGSLGVAGRVPLYDLVDGEKTCSKCLVLKKESDFGKTSSVLGLCNICKPCMAERQRLYRLANLERIKIKKRSIKSRFTEYLSGSRKRSLVFELTFEEFEYLVTSKCHYCGQDGHGVDRKDNSIGYTLENCLPCCSMCNFMKQDYTYEDYISQCLLVASVHY